MAMFNHPLRHWEVTLRRDEEHAQYMEGWIRDANHEMECDSRASARYEEAAYGRDDE